MVTMMTMNVPGSDFGKLNNLAAISTISLTLRFVRDSSIVSLLSSSLSSSMLPFKYRFAPFDAGLLGVDGYASDPFQNVAPKLDNG